MMTFWKLDKNNEKLEKIFAINRRRNEDSDEGRGSKRRFDAESDEREPPKKQLRSLYS